MYFKISVLFYTTFYQLCFTTVKQLETLTYCVRNLLPLAIITLLSTINYVYCITIAPVIFIGVIESYLSYLSYIIRFILVTVKGWINV